MTPLDHILSVDWTNWLIGAALLTVAIVAAWRSYHRDQSHGPRAFTGQIHPDEPAPWYTPVADYFGRHLESAERSARALDHTCFPENKKGAAAVRVPGPVNNRRSLPDVGTK